MVDLHQVEPGMPDGHPWKTYPRWQMAWRTFLGVALVGMLGTGAFALITASDGSASLMAGFLPVIFTVIVPLIAAGLAAALGIWLRRYYPFTQSLLFGAIAVAVVLMLSGALSVLESVLRGPCPPTVYCSEPLDGFFWAVFLFGWPTFLIACIGLGLAIWSPSPRGRKIFPPLVIATSIAFVAGFTAAHW